MMCRSVWGPSVVSGSTASTKIPSGSLSSRGAPVPLVYSVRSPSCGAITTSTASCRRWARVTALLRNAATELVAETMRTLSRPAEIAGNEMPTIRPMMASTTTISSSVMPLFVLPADDVGIDPFTAGLAVGAHADNVRLVAAMLTGEPVNVVHAPRIFGDILRKVRPVPLRRVGRFDAERDQALFGCGERPRIELVRAQRRLEIVDLGAGSRDFGLVHVAPQFGANQGDEQPDDGHHHQHFDEGDTGLGSSSISLCRLQHDYTATSLMLVIASSMLKISAPIKTPMMRITAGSKIAVKRLMEARVSVS